MVKPYQSLIKAYSKPCPSLLPFFTSHSLDLSAGSKNTLPSKTATSSRKRPQPQMKNHKPILLNHIGIPLFIFKRSDGAES